MKLSPETQEIITIWLRDLLHCAESPLRTAVEAADNLYFGCPNLTSDQITLLQDYAVDQERYAGGVPDGVMAELMGLSKAA